MNYISFIKKTVVVILLSLPSSLSAETDLTAQKPTAPNNYVKAVELFDSEDYKKALKFFNKVIESDAPLKWRALSRYRIAKIQLKTGKIKEAADNFAGLVYSPETFEYVDPLDNIRELADIKNSESAEKLKEILKTSKIANLRKAAAENLARVYEKTESARSIGDDLLEILKNEPEINVAKTISEAINSLVEIAPERLLTLYRRGNYFIKERILLLVSEQDDEELVMALQNEVDKQSGSLKNYILWALCKMDPYRFGDIFRGKIIEEEEVYYIRDSGRQLRIFTPLPGDNEDDNLKKMKDRYVVLYGKEVPEGVIYTDFFEDK